MGLRAKILSGVSWSAVARISKTAGNLVVTVILMRLLTPEAYGLIAMALVVIGFANTFKKFGLGSALIQRKNITELQSSSVFWVNILVGLLLFAITTAIAPYAVTFFNAQSTLKRVIQILSFVFIISAVGIVPRAFLKKQMRFKALAKIKVVSVGISGPVAVVSAATGWGVWSLVFKNIINSVAETILLWRYSSWRPQLRVSISKVKSLLLYGANFTGFKIVNRIHRAGDDFLIGKFMSSASLGIYSQAYKIMMIPIGKGIGLITDVLFPALSRVQKNKARTKSIYLKAVRLISFLAFPAMFGLFSTANNFVHTLFGDQWGGMIPVLRAFCLAGAFQALVKPTGTIYESQGRADWLFRWGFVASVILIGFIGIGVWVGTVEAIAYSYVVANAITFYPSLLIPGWLIGMSVEEVLRSVSGNLLAACIMAGGVFILGQVLPEFWSVLSVLGTQVVTGVGLYWSFAYLFELSAYDELSGIVGDGLETISNVR
ncbi:MOP flippase family protein [Salinibacter ruber]|uniref:MOP flippase family protein n=1 Tax=Salinibacter ruber TaxID=146919 RepID=UPI002166CE3C|nr:MOP flippase family protein [Salinibacter ruber]MCS4097995.1 PST family polysaccharide transporter [Salinibacter ruber]